MLFFDKKIGDDGDPSQHLMHEYEQRWAKLLSPAAVLLSSLKALHKIYQTFAMNALASVCTSFKSDGVDCLKF